MEIIQNISRTFGKWFDGEPLRGDEIECIAYSIIIGVLLVVLLVLLVVIAHQAHWLRSIRWLCEDLWHRIRRGNR